jgi:DNA repair exonuclease SbcCD ATPase subunit
MNRRRFLALAGAAAGLAGCTGSDSSPATETSAADTTATTAPPTTPSTPTAEPETATQTPTDTETETLTAARPAEATQSIEAARDDLQKGYEELQTAANDMTLATNYRFDPQPVTRAIESARVELDAASEVATGSQQQQIDALREYATMLEQFTASINAYADAAQDWSTASSYVSAERYDDAISSFEQVEADISTAQDRLSEARSTYNGLAAENLDEIDAAAARSDLDAVEQLYTAVDQAVDAAIEYVDGVRWYQRGAEAYNSEHYSDAVSEFSTAAEKFDAARRRYRRAEDVVGQDYGLRDYMIQQACVSDSYREKASLWSDAALDAANENWQDARAHADEATSVSTSC